MHVGERAARAGPAGKHARGCSCRPVPDCFLGDTPNSASFSCLHTKGGLAEDGLAEDELAEDERNNVLAACRHRNGVCGECASGCLLSFCPVPSAVLAFVPCPAAGTCGRHPACTKARIPDMGHGARDGGCRSAAGTERVRALSCIANGRPVWRSTHGQALSSGQGLSLCLSALPRSGTPCCTRSFASSGIRVLQRSCSRTKFCHKEQTGPPDPCSCSGRAATSALLPGGLCARGRSAKSRKRENPESSERPLTGSGAEAFARPCRCQESAPARLRKSGVRDWAWVPVPRPA